MQQPEIEIVTNKSKLFFTPMFNTILPVSYFGLLRNTYFWYENINEDTFCLLYEFDGSVRGGLTDKKGFTVYEERVLFKSEYLAGYIDYGKHTIYEFRLTDELVEYRNLLIEGKYSKLPIGIKQKIINFNKELYGELDAEHIANILSRDEVLIQKIADDLGVRPELIPEGMSAIDINKELFSNSLKERNNEITEREN